MYRFNKTRGIEPMLFNGGPELKKTFVQYIVFTGLSHKTTGIAPLLI